jgi:hypothetical protein
MTARWYTVGDKVDRSTGQGSAVDPPPRLRDPQRAVFKGMRRVGAEGGIP